MTKEKPILFNSEMVKAILDGRKTMTRRVIKGLPNHSEMMEQYLPSNRVEFYTQHGNGMEQIKLEHVASVKCPYGKVGDRLWVRETWATQLAFDNTKPSECCEGLAVKYFATNTGQANGKKRQAIFMPRWASRITLEITNIRVERLQDITEKDAMAEGIEAGEDNVGYGDSHYGNFMTLWDSINGKDKTKNWEANPWVWVVEFKRS